MPNKTIIFASTNPGKYQEFRKLINLDAIFNIKSLDELGYTLPTCEETGSTFAENAALKATWTKKYLKPKDRNAIIIGDDSGIRIAALNGAPGVFTRRWKGFEMTDEEIITYCLQQLEGHADRSASYITVYAVLPPQQATPTLLNGTTHGVILTKPRYPSRQSGLPFRSLLYLPDAKMMFHEALALSQEKRKELHLGQDEVFAKCRELLLR